MLRARLWSESGEWRVQLSVQSAETGGRRGQSEPWLGQLQSCSRHHPGIIQWPVTTGAMWPGDRPGVTRTERITSWWVSSWSRGCQCSCVSLSEPSEPESSAAPGQWERERERVIALWDWRQQQPSAASPDTLHSPLASQSQGKTTKWLPNLGFNTGHQVCPCCGLCKMRVVVVKLDWKNVQFHANPATDWWGARKNISSKEWKLSKFLGSR